MKKGQGLPLTTIVIALLAILVLVIVAVFTMGGFSRLFQTVTGWIGTTKAYTYDQARLQCEQLCNSLKTSLPGSEEEAARSGYCVSEFWIDVNLDGKKQDNETYKCCDLYKCDVEINGISICEIDRCKGYHENIGIQS